MIDIAVLGLLEDRDLHGYELKKRLVDTLGVSSGVSFGSLYPALARLERLGAVRSWETAAAAIPAIPQTGSLGGELAAYRARMPARHGRSRKVYRITPEGDRLFAELLATEPAAEDARLFGMRLAFARHLSDGARMEMLERRRIRLSDQLTRAAARVRAAGERPDRYLQSLLEHDHETVERDLGWIERLISREREARPAHGLTYQSGAGQASAPEPPAVGEGGAPNRSSRSVAPPPSLGAVTTERGDPRHSPASHAGNHKEIT